MTRITSLIVALMVVVCLSAPALAEDRQPVKTEQVAEGITRLVYADGSEAFDIPARGKEKRVMEFVPTPAQDRNEPNPSKDDSRRGYILFSPEGRDGVLPGYIPAASEVTSKVATFASPNEYEPVTFAVRPLRDLGVVRFSCDGLKGPRGTKIAASDMDVYIVEPTIEQIQADGQKCRWTMKWLRPGNAATGLAGKNVQVYLDVHVPENAKPGVYSGKVTIEPELGKPSSLPVSLQVLPLKLARSMSCGFFRYDWYQPKERAEYHRFELAEMRRAGITQCVISPVNYRNDYGPTPGVSKDGTVDFGIWDQCVDLYREAGFADPPIISFEGLAGSAVAAMGKTGQNAITEKTLVKAEDVPRDVCEFVKPLVRRVYDHSLEAKWPNFYFYPADEPYVGGQNIEMAKFMGDVAREVAPELQIAGTVYHENAWQRLHNLVDLNIAHHIYPCDNAEKNRKWLDLAGSEHSKLYGIDFIGSYDTLWETRRMVFTLEKGGLDGMMCWLQWLSWDMVEMNKTFGPYAFLTNWWKGGPYCMRDKDGKVWRSLAWIGFREGIDDSRYVRTLRRQIEDARIAGNKEAAEKADNALKSVLGEVHWAGDARKTPWDSAHADAARGRLADAAVECSKAKQ